MVQTTYTKTISGVNPGGFNNLFNASNFQQEINADSSIVQVCDYISTHGDAINIVMSDALPGGVTDLDTLVSNHIATSPIQYKHVLSKTIKNDTINSSYYKVYSKWTYEGSDVLGPITKILGIGYKESNVTNFSIQIFDATNGNVMAEQSFTDTVVDSILDLGTISNIPTTRAKIEICFKKTGGNINDVAFIEDVSFYIS